MSPPLRIARRVGASALCVSLAAGCSAPAPDPKIELAVWVPCGSGVECSTLTVPFDYTRPDDRRFTIPLIRIPSKADKPKLLLTNPGGPGISGVKDLRSGTEYFERFVDAYTVVSFDPRGVGGSVPAVQCLDDRQKAAIFDQPSIPTSDAEITRATELAAGIGDACRAKVGDALSHVGTADVARDMDSLRKAMGFDRISYLGFSYGTFLGALYADQFADKTERMVLDSVMSPALTYEQVRHDQAEGMQASVAAFVDDCLSRAECPLSGSQDAALQQISDIIGSLDEKPYRSADGRTLSGARMLALVESAQYSPHEGWASLRETLSHAVNGDWPAVIDVAYSPDLMVNPADSEYLSVVCTDFQTRRDPAAPARLAPQWAAQSPISGGNRAWSLAPCESWPVSAVREPGPVDTRGAGPTLILNTTGDPATPLVWAQSLHDQISDSTMVVVPAPGHIASSQSVCAEDVLTVFLMTGALPPDRVSDCPPG